MPKQPKEKPLGRVTNLTVTRLYNLGNYEHVSYSISAEIPKGTDAEATFNAIVDILYGLKPLRRDYSIARAQRIAGMNPEERAKDNITDEQFEQAKESVAKFGKDVAAQAAALQKFNTLGGTVKHKDAKRNWDHDCDDETPW